MLRQQQPEWRRSTLVEQYAYLGRSQSAARRMLQYGAYLLNGDAGKPFNELRYERAIFEVLEEGGDRHSSAVKHPSPAHALRIAFDSRACRPINHELNDTTHTETTKTSNVRVVPR